MDEKDHFMSRVENCLIKKNIFGREYQNIMDTFSYLFDYYSPPEYVKIKKKEYFISYLNTLKQIKGYYIILLSQLNQKGISQEFLSGIVESKQGYLEYQNGYYIPSLNGTHICTIGGISSVREKTFYTLEMPNELAEVSIIHHEMTHLQEGKNSFPINRNYPFALEFRTMCQEGRAVTHESYLALPIDWEEDVEVIEDCEFTSPFSYPLYGHLYQLLQIAFGDNVMEKYARNQRTDMDMLMEFKKEYASDLIEQLYVYIIYILMVYKNKNIHELEEEIKKYRDSCQLKSMHYNQIIKNSLNIEITSIDNIAKLKKSLKKINVRNSVSFDLIELTKKSIEVELQKYQGALKRQMLANYHKVKLNINHLACYFEKMIIEKPSVKETLENLWVNHKSCGI